MPSRSVASHDELAAVEKTVRRAVKLRNAARDKQRFEVADEIRRELEALGVAVSDTSATTSTWRWNEAPRVEHAEDESRPKKRQRHNKQEQEQAQDKPDDEPRAAETTPPPKKSQLALANGVVAEILRRGDGAAATRGSSVTVKYSGVLAKTRRKFDAGRLTFDLGLGQVIKGWDAGLAGMKVGEKRRLTIPPKMAYGARGAPPDIPKNATLIFDVALLQVAD